MLEDVYLGASGALTGAAREAQIAEEEAVALARTEEIERLNRRSSASVRCLNRN